VLFPGVKKIGGHLGLEQTDSMAVGLVRNCYIRLYDGRNQKVLEVFPPKLEDGDHPKVEALLAQEKIKNFSWSDTSICVVFKEYVKPYSAEKIERIIQGLTALFQEAYPEGSYCCQKCEGTAPAHPYYLGNENFYLCDTCFSELKQLHEADKAEYDSKPNNVLAGTLGALLFAIPGILVTSLFFIFLNRIAALSSVIFVYLATLGYRKFAQKDSLPGAVSINLVSLLMTALGIAVSYCLNIAWILKGFARLGEVLSMPSVQRELGINVLVGLIISALYLALNTLEMVKGWRFPELKRARKIGG
jgi:hypothetical protein